jgi:GYF domain 2
MNPASFYAVKGGRQHGPMSLREFADGWLRGEFDQDTLIWHKGMGQDWGWPDEWLSNTQERAEKSRRYFESGMVRSSLWAFPCWELLRIGDYDFLPRDWGARWEECGGKFLGDKRRMIARKTDPVWEQLGSRERYDDALGLSYPPFVLGTSMMTREVSRQDALALGLIEETATAEDKYREQQMAHKAPAKPSEVAPLGSPKQALDPAAKTRK